MGQSREEDWRIQQNWLIVEASTRDREEWGALRNEKE
jgi:hypothetical protein